VDFKKHDEKIFQTKILRLLSIVCEKPKRNSRIHKKSVCSPWVEKSFENPEARLRILPLL
jgi:hypothetical protein